MEKFLEGEEPTVEELKAAIRRATIAGAVNPILTGTAFKNKGVSRCSTPLLTTCLRRSTSVPSPYKPGDEETALERQPSDDEPLSILAFKIAADPHLGKLTFVRLYSRSSHCRFVCPELRQGSKGASARSTECMQTSVKRSDSVGAGEIVAVMGLKDTTTGETLCDPSAPIILKVLTFPAPVIEVAIEPKTKSDQEKLSTAIQRLSDGDPTFRVHSDEETGQTSPTYG